MQPIRGRIRAVFFDLDGTLIDSEPLHLEAIRKTLAAYGIAVADDEYYGELMPLSYRETAEVLLRRDGHCLPAPAIDEIARLIERDARLRLLRAAPPDPDALACLDAAAALGPVGLVTSTPRTIVEPLLEGWGLAGGFHALICGGDAERAKPAPDPYALALALVNAATFPPVPAASCLVFEDSPHGIRSAKDAGMRVIAVGTRIHPERLREAERIVPRLSPFLLPHPNGCD